MILKSIYSHVTKINRRGNAPSIQTIQIGSDITRFRRNLWIVNAS